MERGIAHSVAEGILTVFAFVCVICGLIAYFFPKTRMFFAILGGIVVLLYLVMGAGATIESISQWNDKRKYGDKILSAPAVIDGLPVKERYARGESGRLSRAILSTDFDVQGFPAKEGTEIAFHENGDLARWIASRDVEIWGRKWPAGTEFTGMMHGDSLTVYPPGEPGVSITKPKP